ncbi:DUF2283 domain-containing protein [Aquamicrobium soli]|jgi:uncharacterized protein YuzE|uniref:DUF2283 domain-containing protein n=1 Tax=Aquamicrobium soli TaxID=1811518 RepID=A0ABV7K7M8_9HYPH
MRHEIKSDPKTDRIIARLAEGKIIESEEVATGVVLDYDSAGEVVAIEVDRIAARRRNALS